MSQNPQNGEILAEESQSHFYALLKIPFLGAEMIRTIAFTTLGSGARD